MQREKIAVITARANVPEQKEILCGIAEAAFAADTDVAITCRQSRSRIVPEIAVINFTFIKRYAVLFKGFFAAR